MKNTQTPYTLDIQTVKLSGKQLYIAKYKEIEGCTGEGETAEEALEELNINAQMWLEVRKEFGLSAPV